MHEPNERRQLLIDVARMYYFENRSQQQIADALNMSRSNVSLLLKNCVENQIIEIKINDTVAKAHGIASEIQHKYNLDTVLIAKSYRDPRENIQSVARLAAHHLRSQLSNDMLLGYTNDLAIFYIAQKLNLSEFTRIHTIQMMGGISSSVLDYDGQELASTFQQKLNGDSYKLHAPLLVKSSSLKKLLQMEPPIAQVFRRYPEIDIAIVYIDKLSLTMDVPDNIYSKADLLQLSEVGAVCRFCGRHLNSKGIPCNAGINSRIMAIDLDTLSKIPIVIGVSANVSNALAVKSCALSGFINCLIIDESLAKKII